MQSIGMQFGPSINAFTSFDETVYQLQIPTDRPDIMDKAMLILEDWAHNVVVRSDGRSTRSASVITEEWRLRPRRGREDERQAVSGAARRLALRGSAADRRHRQHRDVQSRAVEEVLQRLVPAGPDGRHCGRRLRQGDGRAARAAALRGDEESAQPAAPSDVQRARSRGHALHDRHRQGSDDDERARLRHGARAAIRRPSARTGSRSSRRSTTACSRPAIRRCRRSRTRRSSEPAPATACSCARATAATLTAIVKEDGIEKGLDALFTETDRVARFGFTATELARQKQLLQRAFERAVAEKDQQESASYAAEFIRNFTADEPHPRHRLRVAASPALPAGNHARRGQQARQTLGLRQEPCRGRERAGEAGPRRARRAEARGRHQSRVGEEPDRVRRRRDVRAARRNTAHAGHDREVDHQRGVRHHGMGALERRESRPQADDVQG